MKNVPTPTLPNANLLVSAALKSSLQLMAEGMAVALRNPIMLTEMVNPRSIIPTLSRATSEMLSAQTRSSLTMLDWMTTSFEESVRVMESLPLGKEAMGPLPEKTRQALKDAKASVGDFGRNTAGMAYAY
jgi:hypothetical protein